MEVVEVDGAVLVDDLRALVLAGLPDAEHRALGIGEHAMRPESMTSNGSVSTVPPASRTLAAVSSALSTQMYVFQPSAAAACCCELMAADVAAAHARHEVLAGRVRRA